MKLISQMVFNTCFPEKYLKEKLQKHVYNNECLVFKNICKVFCKIVFKKAMNEHQNLGGLVTWEHDSK